MRSEYKYNIKDLMSYIETPDDIVLRRIDNRYSLGLGLTTRCNFDCPMCFYHTNDRQNRVRKNNDFSFSLLQKILTNSPRFFNINISLEGEPFCHPNIFQILDLVASHTESISLTSNASLLSKEKILALRKYNFANLVLSVDASDAASYSSLRKGGDFTLFVKNAALLAESLPNKVILNAVLCDSNLISVQNIPKIAYELGISSINIMQVRLHQGAIQRGVDLPPIDKLKRSLLILFENAEKYSCTIFLDYYFANRELMDWIKSIANENVVIAKNQSGKGICNIPWYYTSILSDGSLFPCCGDLQPMHIKEYSFDGIFNHQYMIALRNCLSNNILTDVCAECHYLV